jgi:hypothetical protein
MQSLTIKSMEVGTYYFMQGPNYDMNAYMATFVRGEA